MLKERLSPADEAARDREMREALASCPRILDLIARGPLADPDAEALVYLRSPLDPNPVVVSNDRLMGCIKAAEIFFRIFSCRSALPFTHLMGCIKAAETFFRGQGIGRDDTIAVLLPICPGAIAAIWGGGLRYRRTPQSPVHA